MNRLRELRLSKNMNMRQAAAKFNLPYTTYVNYEKGARELNSEMLIMFATYYDVSTDYLIGRTFNKNITPIENDDQTEEHDILDEVDFAFFGDYKELNETNKETLRAMARILKEQEEKG